MASENGHLPVVMRLLECPRVLRTVRPLLLARALAVEGDRLAVLLRSDALLRRGHIAAAVCRRRQVVS